MRRSRSLDDGDLADMEDYLRNKIDDLVGKGAGPEDAFRKAEAEFASAERLEDDYYRANARRSGARPPWRLPRFAPARGWLALKIAFRHVRRHKGYALITVGSLALALTVGLLTIGWAFYETGYDGFHRNADSIYRFLNQTTRGSGITETDSSAPVALSFVIKTDFPEVVAASRFLRMNPGSRLETPRLVDYKSSIAFVDPDFLTMFDFPLVKGGAGAALGNPKSILLTESAARKFFGDENPVGQTLLSQEAKIPLLVTGVLKDIPETSHLDFDGLMAAPDYTLWINDGLKPDDWYHGLSNLYVQLAPGSDAAALGKRVTRMANEHAPQTKAVLSLQPLRDIHLRSDRIRSMPTSRRRDAMAMGQIRIFLFVALAVLLMGGINYVNLATARALKRAKEIAVRKVNGAGRGDLVRQFLGEAVLYAFLALAVALGLAVGIGLPLLRRMTGLSLDLALLDKGPLLAAFFGMTLLTGLVSGFYPALFVSSLPCASALKASFRRGRSSLNALRRLLVAVQIACSAALLIVVAVLILQLRFMDRKDLGFRRDSLVVIQNDLDPARVPAVKSDLLSHPAIQGAATGHLPLLGERGHFVMDERMVSWEGKPADARIRMDWIFVDEDYLQTFGLTLVAGRFFSKDHPADKDNYVLNESAVRAMGLKDPVGKRLKTQNRSGTIIGVIKDFHAGTLKAPIRPMFFCCLSGFFSLVVRIDPRSTAAAVGHITAVMKKHEPGRPVEYTFVDDYLRRMYNGDRRNARMVSAFGAVSILISEQRTKEIGIRKVLGASIGRIMGMMSKEFAVLAAVAVVCAVPLAYLIASRWLAAFAYRIPLAWWIFAGAGAVVLGLAMAAVSLRTIQAARANPVESLRYE
jgi:putative ABC transport system permease protein